MNLKIPEKSLNSGSLKNDAASPSKDGLDFARGALVIKNLLKVKKRLEQNTTTQKKIKLLDKLIKQKEIQKFELNFAKENLPAG